MSAIQFAAVTGEVATGTAAKTLLQVVAPANQRLLIHELSVSFKGNAPTADPVLVRVLRQTTAGTMTALTPVKLTPGSEALQSTAQHSATAEPTAGDVLLSEEVHPQGGGFLWQAPFGQALVIPGGGRLGVEVTAGASVSAVARVRGEE
jgi:hypothetical protein